MEFKKPQSLLPLKPEKDPSNPEEKPDFIQSPYEEPSWSGLPPSTTPYKLEVLKNGSIIETVDLMAKPFFMVGRLPICDIPMQHPTVSRFHAVLQYRAEGSTGFYIYDLKSTHGTFLNGKNKLKPKMYAPFKVGHMIRFGCSQRQFILIGPESDAEEESPLSVTELKQARAQKLLEEQQRQLTIEAKKQRAEERGVDWGMGSDEEEDREELGENPYATTTNEELYLDDPKKALRGFYEREGLELEYDCTEQNMGQFLCKVELPVDDDMGRPLIAEVVHKGKKKEAVIQCALEACRILDRLGLLRQATHESRKRKTRDWAENDYYDSDEDTYLDRTGTIEKKRERRMQKQPQEIETLESLTTKRDNLLKSIEDAELKIQNQEKLVKENAEDDDVDPLDSYMNSLAVDGTSTNKMQQQLTQHKKELERITRLLDVVKPVSLPSHLQPSCSKTQLKQQVKKLDKLDAEEATSENQLQHLQAKRKQLEGWEKQLHEKFDEQLAEKIAKDADRVLIDLQELKDKQQEHVQEIESVIEGNDEDDDKKKQKKNLRRSGQRQHKQQQQKMEGYKEDATKEDYNFWVPPEGQTGDGRTKLNEKFGY